MTDFTLTAGDDIFPQPQDDLTQNDRIFAWGGNDLIQISQGSDTVYGGAGDDQILGKTAFVGGEPGTVVFYGGSGNDGLYQGYYDLGCNFFGGDGNDTLSIGRGYDEDTHLVNFADAGAGDDVVSATGAAFSVKGGEGQDTLSIALFTPGSVRFDGSGPEVVFTVDGVSTSVVSGFEAFHIQSYRQDDVLIGGDLADELDGDLGLDLLYGGGGNDTLNGETVYGGDGDDFIPGVSSTNNLRGPCMAARVRMRSAAIWPICWLSQDPAMIWCGRNTGG